jgi:hypothetical protein
MKIEFSVERLFDLQILLMLLVFVGACNDQEFSRNTSHLNISVENLRKGKELAANYCQSCHLLPDPALLDTKTWEKGVLPVMGPMLGVFQHQGRNYPSMKSDANLDSNFYPKSRLVSVEEWQYILDYYVATSPEYLIGKDSKVITGIDLPGFRRHEVDMKIPSPTSAFVEIVDSTNRLWLSDLFQKKIFSFDKDLELVDSFTINASVVDIGYSKEALFLTDIGEINPDNREIGSLRYLHVEHSRIGENNDSIILNNLARPVQVLSGDFNNDQQTDYLVCEYGFLRGSLSIYFGNGRNSFTKKIIKNSPGAGKVYIDDFNNDGLPDIWAMFAQADEGISLFLNNGNKVFKEERLLRFPSVYGSTFFELVDFNNDKYLDIVYTCGDNADYSSILKPYHGIYIFLNNGRNKFTQKYFYPMDGCFKALARDYDSDGDLDIASISFFADYSKVPDQSFVYLQNQGDFQFKAHSFDDSKRGRWISMDAGDLNGDKKIDIVLGNFSYGPVMMSPSFNWKEGASLILLENKSP